MPTVLLVDDSPVARRAVAQRLAAEGFAVREAASASDVHAVDASAVDLAVIDVELPDGDGPALAAELRAHRPALPVAFFTATASDALRERSRDLGPVFRKPDLAPLVAWARSALASAGQPPPTK